MSVRSLSAGSMRSTVASWRSPRSRRLIGAAGSHLVLILFAFTALAPLALVAINSLKTHREVVRSPLAMPTTLHWENFELAWRYGQFSRGFVNSILLSGTAVATVLTCSTLAGYVLARRRIRQWRMVTVYFMVAMTVPIQLFLFPLYYFFARVLGLLGSLYGVGVVLAALNMPLAVFLMRSFFLAVPEQLEEAARIDGANTARVLWSVLLPPVRPGLITVAVIVGLQAWNEFLITRTFLGQESITATLGLLSMNGTFTDNMSVMMAGTMLMIGPPLVFFALVQRYFIEGLISGALKG